MPGFLYVECAKAPLAPGRDSREPAQSEPENVGWRIWADRKGTAKPLLSPYIWSCPVKPKAVDNVLAGAYAIPAFFLSFRIIPDAPSFGTESRAAVARDSFRPKGWDIKSACGTGVWGFTDHAPQVDDCFLDVGQSKNGVSSLEIHRASRVMQKTAW